MSGAEDPRALTIPGIPGSLEWHNPPAHWDFQDGALTITAGKTTDWFVDPFDGRATRNSPMALFEPAQEFVLSALVTVDHRSKWDAGALVLRVDETTWAKFALELSAEGRATFVSVVTRGRSDDCNSSTVEGHSAYLQSARSRDAFVFYSSPDGNAWQIVRSFTLGPARGLRAGFSSQSPTGEGCRATFSNIRYAPKGIANIYTGK